jgi:hypothetical protein
MRGKSQTCTVKDGRIRLTCTRCAKKQFIVIPPGTRKKTARCQCGLSTQLTLNHRATPRESTCGKALIILQNGRQCPVYLCDMSQGGVGFNIPHQYTRSVAVGQEIAIKYRTLTGSSIQRRIRVKSIIYTRAGAEFLDGRIPSF